MAAHRTVLEFVNAGGDRKYLSRACADCKLAMWQWWQEQRQPAIRLYCHSMHALIQEPIEGCSDRDPIEEKGRETE